MVGGVDGVRVWCGFELDSLGDVVVLWVVLLVVSSRSLHTVVGWDCISVVCFCVVVRVVVREVVRVVVRVVSVRVDRRGVV